MELAKKAIELAATLRQCASRGGCRHCPLDNYIGCCSDKLKTDAAELIEDQQAVIESLAAKIGEMTASIVKPRDKYAGAGYGQEKE